MSKTFDLRRLLRTAEAEFRTINRNRNLTKPEKKQLKAFYLEHILAPEAQRLLRGTNPTNGNPAPGEKDRWRGQRLLTARDLQSWLKIDEKTIYHYAKRKLIPYVRVKTNIRFRENEIRQWLSRHSHLPAFMRAKRPRKHGRKAR